MAGVETADPERIQRLLEDLNHLVAQHQNIKTVAAKTQPRIVESVVEVEVEEEHTRREPEEPPSRGQDTGFFGTNYGQQLMNNSGTVTNNFNYSGGIHSHYHSREPTPRTHLQNVEICADELNPLTSREGFDRVLNQDAPQWLLNHESYAAWTKDAPTSIEAALLTLSGKPGIGKSVLMKAAVLATEAQRQLDTRRRTVTLRYFFNHTDLQARTSIALFRSLLGQLLCAAIPGLPSEEKIRKWADATQEERDAKFWTSRELQRMIQEVVTHGESSLSVDGAGLAPVRFRLFIDALNECTDEPSSSADPEPGDLKVLNFINELLSAGVPAGVDIGVCISRRVALEHGHKEPKSRMIDLGRQEEVTASIRQFVFKQLASIPEVTSNPGLHQRLREILLRQCWNGFRHCSKITGKLKEEAPRSSVQRLCDIADGVKPANDQLLRRSTDMETYEKSMARIVKERDQEGMRLFQLAAVAFRPLTPDELRHALAFTSEFKLGSIAEWENTVGLSQGAFENSLRFHSDGLLEITTADFEEDYHYDEGERVKFVNNSLKGFLLGERGLGSLSLDNDAVAGASPQSSEKLCHLLLFNSCVRALNAFSIKDDSEAKFLKYVCEFWLRHAQAVDDEHEETAKLPDFMRKCTTRQARAFVRNQIKYLRESQAIEIMVLGGPQAGDDDPGSSMPALLATFGCTTLLERHLTTCKPCKESWSKGEQASSWDAPHLMALNHAIMGGWTNTALFLLKTRCGDDLNVLLRGGKTLLYTVCYFMPEGQSQIDIVKFLLEHGADPLQPSPWTDKEFPLHVAIEKRRMKLIKALLQHKNDRAYAYELLAAARQGGDEEEEEDDDESRRGWNALHTAVGIEVELQDKRKVLDAILDAIKELPIDDEFPEGRFADLLELKDGRGNTPQELAKKVECGPDADLLFDKLDEFEDE